MTTCCGGAAALDAAKNVGDVATAARQAEFERTARQMPDGTAQYNLSVPAIHCGHCMATIERALAGMDGIRQARVNLSLRRVAVTLDSYEKQIGPVLEALNALGYPAHPVDGDSADQADDKEAKELLRALGVAGFAAGNIMLLSVSVWSGAEGATRDLFHLVSALIAIPAVAWAGQVFFRSAWRALRGGRLNMDVPISLAVLLALGMSLFESLTGGAEVYFDAAVTLLFFLLIGRTLDHLMRRKARAAVSSLGHLAAKGAMLIDDNGQMRYLPADEIEPGMRLLVAAGERIPVDCEVEGGESDVDRSLVTGESAPAVVAPGTRLEAGTLNLSGPLEVRARTDAQSSFLADVMRMMDAAEHGRGRYIRIADRIARLYAPAVHAISALAFVGWIIFTGDWHSSIMVAISVLIITCPCALGLAVPVAHVIAAGRLFEAGIMMKDGAALEKLAVVDHAVFDKTGTLTTGIPAVISADIPAGTPRAVARALAMRSSHPASKALASFLSDVAPATLTNTREVPGYGVEAMTSGGMARLGRASWVAEIAAPTDAAPTDAAKRGGLAFALSGKTVTPVALSETVRQDAREAISLLAAAGIGSELMSGDSAAAVEKVGDAVGIPAYTAGATPAGKIDRIQTLQADGHRVLMVGDGLNDGPALAAADVSMAPASASDVGRQAADFVFTRESLKAAPFARQLARRTAAVVHQNFALAFGYNCVAVPLAIAGHVTPLIAALAMSASSIVVVANSMRLRWVSAGAATATVSPAPARDTGALTENAATPERLAA